MASIHDIVLFASTGAALFSLVGALFGALAGAYTRADGRAAGGLFGNAVASALGKLEGETATRPLTGLIVGAVDGAVFLGAVGLIVGLVLAFQGDAFPLESLRLPLAAAVLLAIGAVLLGALAYFLIWGGSWAVGLVFTALVGAVVGSWMEARLNVAGAPFYGALAGAALGALGALHSGRSPGSKDREGRPG
jgi:hypothetical protein